MLESQSAGPVQSDGFTPTRPSPRLTLQRVLLPRRTWDLGEALGLNKKKLYCHCHYNHVYHSCMLVLINIITMIIYV